MTCPVLFPLPLSFLLGNPSDHLENVIVRIETLLEITHEVVRSCSVHCLLHSEELVSAEQIVELNDCLSNPVDLLIDLLLLLSCGFITAHSAVICICPESLAVILNGHLDSSLVSRCLIVFLIWISWLVVLIPDNVDDEFRSCESHTTHVDVIKTSGTRLALSISERVV